MKHLFLIIIFLSELLFSSDYYSNSNSTLFIFPQSASTGGAGLAFNRDAAPLSNPANLPVSSSSEIGLAYSGYYDNAFTTTLISFASKISDRLGVGMFMGYLYIPDIEYTGNLDLINYKGDTYPIYDPSKIKMISCSEMFYNFSFGYTLFENKKISVSGGAAFHFQRRRLDTWTGYGIGADAGFSAILKQSGLRFSLLFSDLTTNYIRWSSDYHDAGKQQARVGLGWRRELPALYSRLSIMYTSPDIFGNSGTGYNIFTDGDKPIKTSVREKPMLLLTSGRYGVEYLIHKTVAFRLGLNEEKRLFFGSGIALFKQSLLIEFSLSGLFKDYDLGSVYFISMKYTW